MSCQSCGALLGYAPARRDIVDLHRTDRPETFIAGEDSSDLWRCLNAAWGCNWMVEAASGTEWCASCRLTNGRPATGDVEAMHAWAITEVAKRRVVHQLAGLGLPIEGRSPAHPGGLVFELVHVPGASAVTGHLDGVITIDLTEADDVRREGLRRDFGEGSRTMLGHIRHEIGHYYWPLLAGTPDRIEEFRALFGDERTDYGRALEDHRRNTDHDWDRSVHISSYASSHPAEDWAETFAHHLLITDVMETVRAQGLLPADHLGSTPGPSFAAQVDAWRSLAARLDAIAESLGGPALYPFTLTSGVVDKLVFVDRSIRSGPWRGSHDERPRHRVGPTEPGGPSS